MEKKIESTIGDPSRARWIYEITRTKDTDERVIYQIIVMGLLGRGLEIFNHPRYQFIGLGYGVNIRVNRRFVITVAIGNHTIDPIVNISVSVDDDFRPWYIPEFMNYGESKQVNKIRDVVLRILAENNLLLR